MASIQMDARVRGPARTRIGLRLELDERIDRVWHSAACMEYEQLHGRVSWSPKCDGCQQIKRIADRRDSQIASQVASQNANC